MGIMESTAKHFLAEGAARSIKKEILKAGLETLKALAGSGRSIVGTYLVGCSEERKKQLRQDLKDLLKMGVTIDMIVDKVARQIPELGSIMRKDSYRKAEVEKITAFLKEG